MPDGADSQNQAHVSLEATRDGGMRAEVVAVVTKDDLRDAKDDLRREMKLWLGAGSFLGTTISGVLGVVLTGHSQEAQQTTAAVVQALPFF